MKPPSPIRRYFCMFTSPAVSRRIPRKRLYGQPLGAAIRRGNGTMAFRRPERANCRAIMAANRSHVNFLAYFPEQLRWLTTARRGAIIAARSNCSAVRKRVDYVPDEYV